MQEQTWWKLHCASCLLVFCAVVWCCWCWLRSEWGKLKPSKPIHILTALFTTRIHKENKHVLPYQPTLLKNFGQHNLLHVSLSACWKTEAEPMQEQTWWKLHCASCLLVFCAVVWCCWCWWWSEWWKKNNPNTIHIGTALFTTRVHKENRQVLPYQPYLGKTLTNIIYCMCLFQHVGKQDRTHARTTQLSYSNCWSPLVGVRKKWEQIIGWKDVTFNLMVFVCVALFFGRYTVLAAGSAVLYCIHMQHCTYIICSYSICICCLHILSAVWGLSYLAFFPYSICELENFIFYLFVQHSIRLKDTAVS